MPVLCEGTSRMTRAASDCTSERGKNYFDSRLMSDMAILRQLPDRSTNCGPLHLANGTPRHPVHTGDNRMQWFFRC